MQCSSSFVCADRLVDVLLSAVPKLFEILIRQYSRNVTDDRRS